MSPEEIARLASTIEARDAEIAGLKAALIFECTCESDPLGRCVRHEGINAEREACARACRPKPYGDKYMPDAYRDGYKDGCSDCERAIRARGKEQGESKRRCPKCVGWIYGNSECSYCSGSSPCCGGEIKSGELQVKKYEGSRLTQEEFDRVLDSQRSEIIRINTENRESAEKLVRVKRSLGAIGRAVNAYKRAWIIGDDWSDNFDRLLSPPEVQEAMKEKL